MTVWASWIGHDSLQYGLYISAEELNKSENHEYNWTY